MPIITGLQNLLQDLQGWMLLLAVPFVVIQAVILGFGLTNTEDPHEEKRIKGRFIKIIIGAAIVACSPWIGTTILSYFGA